MCEKPRETLQCVTMTEDAKPVTDVKVDEVDALATAMHSTTASEDAGTSCCNRVIMNMMCYPEDS